MNPKSLQRDAKKVHEALKELDDGRLIALKELKIYIPARFAERELAFIGIETVIVGIYAIVVDDAYYGVSTVNAMMRIEPTITNKIKYEDEEYYEFVFPKGSTVLASVHLVRIDTLTYRIYDEIISKGRVPWYLSYSDMGRLFDTAKYHANANIGQNNEVTELIVSMISRDSKDRTRYYRQTVKTLDDVIKNPPAFIPLRSVQYAATNTTNKLAGSYFSDGLVSALVSPADRVERIEDILRR